jgi:UDP-N-acetylglucosamine:LPS N-acetylglucosamine transferase
MQLLLLRAAWEAYPRQWVTLEGSDSRSLLAGENVVYAHPRTSRSLRVLAKNLILAWRVVSEARPRVVLTTGAGAAVPFAWIARLRGARLVYVESLTRIDTPSLSCRLLAPFADRVYVQWPELVNGVGRARYVGGILALRET